MEVGKNYIATTYIHACVLCVHVNSCKYIHICTYTFIIIIIHIAMYYTYVYVYVHVSTYMYKFCLCSYSDLLQKQLDIF